MPAHPLSCGLLRADIRRTPVPLQGISVDVQVKGFVADVSATLKYKNDEEKAVEAVFVFPKDEDSAVYSFEATVEEKTIVADLQEKKQAHKTYEDAMQKGRQAYLLEESGDSCDVFTCHVGNLPPKQVAEVTIKYVQELSVEADGAVRFVLPAVLNPRYTPRDHAFSVTATRPQVPIGEIPYTLSLSAHFQSAFGIAKISSNCDISPVEYMNEEKTSAKLSLAEGHKFDRDVELLAYYMEVYRPSVAVEAGLDADLAVPGSFMSDQVVMLSLFPSVPAQQEEATSWEFIFLMDRSGSMQSPMSAEPNAPIRIQSAKETLILMIKSLPLRCHFNVFGFGSHFVSFFTESVEYTQETMEEAIKHVKEMDANFGGTEILLPLKRIYSTGKTERLRQVFIFTDGEVGNTKAVIKEVMKNSHNHRCFTFGIGEGASTSLIKGMARAGSGAYDFITGKDRMQTKVLRAMRHALQPSVTDVSLTWTLPVGLEASVLSTIPTSIFQGQMSIIYSQLKGNMAEESDEGRVSLQYKLKGEMISNAYSFPLNLKNVHSSTIHRLAGKALIAKLECGLDSDSEEVKKRVLETSLQSGVISSLTAFVAVMKDTKVTIKGPPVRRDIPAPAFGFPGLFSVGVPQLFGSTASSGPFAFGSGPRAGTSKNGRAPSSGSYTFRRAPPAGTSVHGSAPSSGRILPYGLAQSFEVPGGMPGSGGGGSLVPVVHLGAPGQSMEMLRSSVSPATWQAYEILGLPTSGASVFGSAPSSGTSLRGSAPSSGRILPYGLAPSFGTLDVPSSEPITCGRAPSAGASVFGSAPSSGNFAFGSASSLGTPIFGSAISSGSVILGSASFLDDCAAEEEISPQMKLILLQKADGSWSPSPELAAVLGISETDLEAGNPDQGSDSSVWATVLAVIWLHVNCVEQKDEWELLSWKAVSWLRSKAGFSLSHWVTAGTELLKSSVDLAIFGL